MVLWFFALTYSKEVDGFMVIIVTCSTCIGYNFRQKHVIYIQITMGLDKKLNDFTGVRRIWLTSSWIKTMQLFYRVSILYEKESPNLVCSGACYSYCWCTLTSQCPHWHLYFFVICKFHNLVFLEDYGYSKELEDYMFLLIATITNLFYEMYM